MPIFSEHLLVNGGLLHNPVILVEAGPAGAVGETVLLGAEGRLEQRYFHNHAIGSMIEALVDSYGNNLAEIRAGVVRDAGPADRSEVAEGEEEPADRGQAVEADEELASVLDHVRDPNLEAFICPISQGVFEDPVVVSDGFTYERNAIMAWAARCIAERHPVTSPLTRGDLEVDVDGNLALVDNQLLTTILDEYLARLSEEDENVIIPSRGMSVDPNTMLESFDDRELHHVALFGAGLIAGSSIASTFGIVTSWASSVLTGNPLAGSALGSTAVSVVSSAGITSSSARAARAAREAREAREAEGAGANPGPDRPAECANR